ncbi:branched-chain amino acid ABC transporter permease [Azospirillum sp. RWY-5-1]|uniref:Branched-chain amino acid ABC transporter permease n=1 Tax=Azospirillum oleiclasticum TaxID=2735135 RepID=A0ABX2T657_9PROT|nr:branched-chain amino acid ABC transporter permease [Azospirillum oleiclasticum]NYZ12621.1 branched-chain amino acid ABC transporter permease [Azospirillum oleiclasticum]NYZ19781.1 branched-chain amino acid ABC transporter permease [Azospirillum oleiclasticum]
MQTVYGIVIDGIAYGMILFIISVGLSVTLGLMRVVNLAHGAFAMVAGYLASYAVQAMGVPYLVALLAVVALTVALALPLERLLYRRIYGSANELAQVLLTIGLTFVVVASVNYIFGPTLKRIPLPEFLTGTVDLGPKEIPAHRAFVIVVGVAALLGLWGLLERTDFGIRLRAAVENPEMAAALGIRTERLYAITFGLGVGLAALGGVLGAELLPLEPYYALRYIVLFLAVVAVGGAGSIFGSAAAALSLGIIDTAGKYLYPSFGEFFFYAAIMIILFRWPHGFFQGKSA